MYIIFSSSECPLISLLLFYYLEYYIGHYFPFSIICFCSAQFTSFMYKRYYFGEQCVWYILFNLILIANCLYISVTAEIECLENRPLTHI